VLDLKNKITYMKQTIAIVLLTSFGAMAQVTQGDLIAKLKPLNSQIAQKAIYFY
jgi:hypothetical protein